MTKKKTILIAVLVIVAVLAILSVAVCLMAAGNKKGKKTGEIYFHQTESEHVKSADDGTMYIDNEILLVADENAKYKDIERLADANDAEIVGWIEQTNDYQLQLNKPCDADRLEQIAATFQENDLVVKAYANYAFSVSETATKERDGFIYGEKWEDALQNFSDCEGKSWGIEAVNALAAWDVLDSHKSEVHPVKVGLIDGGFDTEHEDLSFAETFYNTFSDDHGTHVAGTIAAKANNKEGICGVYPYGDGNLYGVSYAASFDNPDEDLYTSSMFLKIAYAELILRNVKVINSSLGFNHYRLDLQIGSPEWQERVDFLESHAYILGDFLNRLLNKGYDFVLVNAAGNDSERENKIIYDSKYNWWTTVIDKEHYPDVFDRIIVVGANASDGSICDFSNGGDRVDIYAPGDEIYSTVENNKYDNSGFSGTSMAAPHVSGVAAIVWSLNHNLTGAQVKEIVCGSHNPRFNACDIVDAYVAAEKAAATIGLSEDENLNNGGILCWVVSAKDEETKIENATVTITNTQTGEKFNTKTDVYGHFELFVPAGKYTLTVQAEGYVDFNWPNEKEPYTNPIIVEKNKVNYLNDWIEMSDENSAVLSPESAVDIYLANRQIWRLSSDHMPMQGYGYCLLDLDFDGVLELIASTNDGSGRYSYNKFYRINLDELTVEEFQPESDQSYGGIDYYIMSDKSRLLRDRSTGKQFYLFQDYGRVSTYEGVISYSESYMENGKLYENFVFSEYWHPDYEHNTSAEIREYNFRGKEISKSDYEEKTKSFYDTNSDLHLAWQVILGDKFDEANAAARKQQMLNAYRGFSYDGFSFDTIKTYNKDITKENSSVHFGVSYYNKNIIVPRDEYMPNLKLERDGTFTLIENLAENMGTYRGTYEIDGNSMLLSVRDCDFDTYPGIRGSDVKSIEFIIADQDTLILNDDLCMSSKGDEFKTKKP